ncbi:hypothetical protein B9Z19DRAFT_1109226 [Tuber borchii]|uniref:Uncharacterized protein n=1 Tax=Tuber borchii TaxID=42251 RepID=A0A2T6ZMX2_TUBBO|nr:hypothetical protein B9Z19DRAFT_1109226 [Tuber borchii]
MSEIIAEVHAAARKKRGQKEPAPIKRNPRPQAQDAPAEEIENDEQCDAILVTKCVIRGEENMKAEAKASLSHVLLPEQREEFYVEGHESKLFVANQLGLTYGRSLNHLEDTERKLKEARVLIAQYEVEINRLCGEVSLLEDRSRELNLSLESYKVARNRFILVYKRDKLGVRSEADRLAIRAGNATVHGGDAITDASLYTVPVGGREDVGIFEQLYGLNPWSVQRLKYPETVAVLNEHAKVLASDTIEGTEKFYHLFNNFIQLFKETGDGYDEAYLQQENTPVFNAYWRWKREKGDEVKPIPRPIVPAAPA